MHVYKFTSVILHSARGGSKALKSDRAPFFIGVYQCGWVESSLIFSWFHKSLNICIYVDSVNTYDEY